MRDHQADFPVATLGRVLRVSSSRFCAWRDRPPSARAQRDAELLTHLRAFHARSDGTYGAPRLIDDLRDIAIHVGQKRVAHVMKLGGLVGVHRRRGVRTTRRGPDESPATDLVQRNFTAAAPNQLWVADITYVPAWAGFLYLAVVLDAWSRRVVGWAMATHLKDGPGAGRAAHGEHPAPTPRRHSALGNQAPSTTSGTTPRRHDTPTCYLSAKAGELHQ